MLHSCSSLLQAVFTNAGNYMFHKHIPEVSMPRLPALLPQNKKNSYQCLQIQGPHYQLLSVSGIYKSRNTKVHSLKNTQKWQNNSSPHLWNTKSLAIERPKIRKQALSFFNISTIRKPHQLKPKLKAIKLDGSRIMHRGNINYHANPKFLNRFTFCYVISNAKLENLH